MPASIREYHRPADRAAALEALRHATPLVLGARVPDRLYAGVEGVADLARLELAYIREDSGFIRIGALTSLQAVADSALLQSTASGMLAQAATLAAGSALRSVATVAGALANQMPSGTGTERLGPPEVVLALLALEAGMLFDAGSENPIVVSLEHFLAAGMRPAAGELLVELSFKAPGSRARAALVRLARTPRDQAIVAAVALMEPGAGQIRVALAGASPLPLRLPQVEQSFAAQGLTAEFLAGLEAKVAAVVNASGDFLASAAYRAAMAPILVRRAIEQAAGDAAA